jgi:Leucine-rich repeat (LRR) protein
MKTLFLWMLVLTIASVSNAQNVDIPDANFKNALIEAGVDTSGDGEISYAEAEAQVYLFIFENSITDLTGIEAFINVDTMEINNTQAISLDVSACTALKFLTCAGNQFTSLDVSGCTSLIYLNCEGNQLDSLDVSNNTSLSHLECHNNELVCLNISKNTDLYYLECGLNYLSSLDVSACTTLTELHCINNLLDSLDVSNNTALRRLNCGGNQLTILDVSSNTILEYLYCANNQLTTLNVSNNTVLTYLNCNNNQLLNIDVSNNTELSFLNLSNMQTLHKVCVWEMPFPPVKVTVYKTDSPNADFTIECGANFVNIPDTAFLHALIDEGIDTNGDSLISYAEAEALTSLNVGGEVYCPPHDGCTVRDGNISDLTGIEAFINLDSLNIEGNKIDSIDLSENNDLRYINCSVNSLSNLDVSENKTLQSLFCSYNQLTSLDVSGCAALTHLGCHANQLTSLDVSGCAALTHLYCFENQLTSLDVSNNIALINLHCSYNQLTSLDVTNNTSLTTLICGGNQLTNLDVSNNTELGYLYLSDMPTLYEVCVWESFPAGVDVDTNNSPNVQFTTDCAVNALNVFKEISKINIYPNPSDDIINIEIESPINATIEIYNVSGRLVFSKKLNSKKERIDISGLSKGMYFVKVRQEQNVRIDKLIVY